MSLHKQVNNRVSPGATEPVAHDFINAIGGPFGRFAQVGSQRFWTPLRVLIFTSLLFLAGGFLTKANCIQGSRSPEGVISLNWSGNRQYTSACYNDIVPLYSGRGLDMPGFPYAFSWQEGDLTRYMEYPVLGGIFQWICAIITRFIYPIFDALPFHSLPEAGLYFIVTALALSFFWVLVIRMVAELTGNRVWDTVLVAASPLVAVHAFTNWDIPSITAVVAAMLAVKRGNFMWAGVLIGLGTAFKLWPLYLLGAYLVLSVRTGKLPNFFKMLAAAVVSWVVVNGPVMLMYPNAWNEFLRLNRERGAEWTTIYQVIDRNIPLSFNDPATLNVISFALFGLSCLAIAIFGLRVQRQPRVAELAFLIVAAFLLFNKVWSPQYSLWLVPLAVLALPRWKLLLTWMVVDAMVWPILMWHMLGAENMGIPHEMLDLIVLLRDGFVVAMVVLVIRQMCGLAADPVADAHQGLDPLLPNPQRAAGVEKQKREVN
ncbi:glycosyltransferase family 87 protein [Corynebacterium callunae]|uniref:glycosyltransferase family 87 protein n=1 Tax=Corynebacterium callunae TaxID=1721 RepID=UPI001FFEA48A|nr:glycosyltransferase family 87 protein [Corynebacterium callunae]MCK2200737.1 glycosyltransferase family 87 protein [Corynebacterium callunae]